MKRRNYWAAILIVAVLALLGVNSTRADDMTSQIPHQLHRQVSDVVTYTERSGLLGWEPYVTDRSLLRLYNRVFPDPQNPWQAILVNYRHHRIDNWIPNQYFSRKIENLEYYVVAVYGVASYQCIHVLRYTWYKNKPPLVENYWVSQYDDEFQNYPAVEDTSCDKLGYKDSGWEEDQWGAYRVKTVEDYTQQWWFDTSAYPYHTFIGDALGSVDGGAPVSCSIVPIPAGQESILDVVSDYPQSYGWIFEGISFYIDGDH